MVRSCLTVAELLNMVRVFCASLTFPSVQSIEAIIMRFVALADQKVREAQQKATVQVAVDINDLRGQQDTRENLARCSEWRPSKDHMDKTLENNARLKVYQSIAQQAFKFCLTHNRKVECRRLCETLHLHLSNVAKYAHPSTRSPSALTSPPSR
ncbi:hypothetical protein K438DRAFT_1878257 [Mycena galopus ATCC 62051]|nr:hypothetical protein K438DRAFT_1878257 [Mycena galopus ATCC 62051]